MKTVGEIETPILRRLMVIVVVVLCVIIVSAAIVMQFVLKTGQALFWIVVDLCEEIADTIRDLWTSFRDVW